MGHNERAAGQRRTKAGGYSVNEIEKLWKAGGELAQSTELRVNLYKKYIINNEKKKKRVRKNISLPLGPRFGIWLGILL